MCFLIFNAHRVMVKLNVNYMRIIVYLKSVLEVC
jgi:hypothetical protein